MCRNASLFLLRRLKGSMSSDARDFNNIETRAVMKTVTTKGIVDQIHELILEDRWISAKSIAEQLGISRERVGSIIRDDLDMRKLSAKWVPKCLNADQKRQRCQSSEQLLDFFFRRDPNDFLSCAIGDHGRNLVMSL